MSPNTNSRLRRVRGSLESKELLLILALFIAACAIRAVGIDWGLPSQNYVYSRFEADEPGVFFTVLALGRGAYTNLLKNYPLFYYLMFLLFAIYYAIGAVFGRYNGWSEFEALQIQDLSQMLLLGRAFGVVVSGLVVVATYVLGRKMFGKRVGLVGAVFMLFSFGHVVLSAHFRLDPFLPLAFVAAFYLMLRAMDTPPGKLRPYVLMALALVVALATKVTAWSLLVPLALLPVLTGPYFKVGKLRIPRPDRRLVFAVYVTAGFYIALIAPAWRYLLTFSRQAAARIDLTDDGSVSSTINPSSISPYKYSGIWHLTRILPSQMGAAIYLLAIAGLVLMLFDRKRRNYVLLMWALLIAYMVPIGLSTRTTWRDMLPVLPFLAISAGYALVTLLRFAGARIPRLQAEGRQAAALGALVVVLVAMPASSIWRQQTLITSVDTRDIAKGWIESNIDRGSRLAIESYGPGVLEENYTDGFRSEFLAVGQGSVLTESRRPTYQVFLLNWDVRSGRDRLEPDQLAKYLKDNQIDYVVVSSGYYARFYNDAVDKLFPELAANGRRFHDLIESNLELVHQLIPNWANRPGPVIKIYKVPSNLDLDSLADKGSFEPFPGMDRPASIVGYYQFSPR